MRAEYSFSQTKKKLILCGQTLSWVWARLVDEKTSAADTKIFILPLFIYLAFSLYTGADYKFIFFLEAIKSWIFH